MRVESIYGGGFSETRSERRRSEKMNGNNRELFGLNADQKRFTSEVQRKNRSYRGQMKYNNII